MADTAASGIFLKTVTSARSVQVIVLREDGSC